jgi:hypothetical protein
MISIHGVHGAERYHLSASGLMTKHKHSAGAPAEQHAYRDRSAWVLTAGRRRHAPQENRQGAVGERSNSWWSLEVDAEAKVHCVG